jgi:hypothetical protein
MPPPKHLGLIPGPDRFALQLRVRGYPPADVELFARDSIATVVEQVRTATGSPSVAIVRDGVPLSTAEAPPVVVADLFGSHVDVLLDGARHSVNDGERLAATGAAARRTIRTSYLYTIAGGAVVVASCVALWRRSAHSGTRGNGR